MIHNTTILRVSSFQNIGLSFSETILGKTLAYNLMYLSLYSKTENTILLLNYFRIVYAFKMNVKHIRKISYPHTEFWKRSAHYIIQYIPFS